MGLEIVHCFTDIKASDARTYNLLLQHETNCASKSVFSPDMSSTQITHPRQDHEDSDALVLRHMSHFLEDVARRRGTSVAQLLAEAGGNPSVFLRLAVMECDVKTVKLLLEDRFRGFFVTESLRDSTELQW